MGRWPSLRPPKLAIALLPLLLVAGCGEAGGVSEGARVTAYVTAPLCAEAKRALARRGGKAGEVELHVSCLPEGERGGRQDLAAIGAGARRATEDSTAIAYVTTTTDPTAVRFSETILEEAGIARLAADSGAAAMDRLVDAIERAGDAGNLREAVADAL